MSNPIIQVGRLNVYVGAAGLVLASIGGLALGLTFDQFATKDGYHLLTLVRFYLREGHSHGMPIAMYNLIVGLLVDRWFDNPHLKKTCSISAALGLILPIGLAAKGVSGADPNFVPFGIIGAFGLLISFISILITNKKGEKK